MQTVQALPLQPVWVNPGHLVRSARLLLEGHRLRALGVLEGTRLVGIVSAEHLQNVPDSAPVSSVMGAPRLIVEGDTSIRRVAEQFIEADADYAPVTYEGRFVGLVTAAMLLRELGRSWDPLTGLSWADHLREWGIESLRAGTEISILFLDLDEFGHYNKRFGHIVGDRVLQRSAQAIRDLLDPSTDVLVRYGGDEFAVGTVRNREEAETLGRQIEARIAEIDVGEQGESVTASVGVTGGKRTKERDKIHYAATLDNLINLASKDCLARKARRQTRAVVAGEIGHPAVAPTPPSNPNTIEVVSVFADDSGGSVTQVVLSVGGSAISGVSSRLGRPLIESVATATCKALERAFSDSMLRIHDIRLAESEEGKRLVCVAGDLILGERSMPVGASAEVERDLFRAVAQAVIQAFAAARATAPA